MLVQGRRRARLPGAAPALLGTPVKPRRWQLGGGGQASLTPQPRFHGFTALCWLLRRHHLINNTGTALGLTLAATPRPSSPAKSPVAACDLHCCRAQQFSTRGGCPLLGRPLSQGHLPGRWKGQALWTLAVPPVCPTIPRLLPLPPGCTQHSWLADLSELENTQCLKGFTGWGKKKQQERS